jgi:hypothetical protein
MVHICKPKKTSNATEFLTKVAALMINMQYNRKIYNLETMTLDKDNKEKFNVVKYNHFNDVYNFNRGYIYIISNTKSTDWIENTLRALVIKMDVLADESIFMHANMGTDLITTQYTLLWTKVEGGNHSCQFYKIKDIPINKRYTKKKMYNSGSCNFRFNWYMGSIFNRLISFIFNDYRNYRALSTIIIDMDDIVKYDEVGLLIKNHITFAHNNLNIRQFNDKYYDFNIKISSIFGIEAIFLPDDLYAMRIDTNINTKFNFINYDDSRIRIWNNNRFYLSHVPNMQYIFTENYIGEKFASKEKMIEHISIYDICSSCKTIVYDDIYLLKMTKNIDKFYFAIICKFCFHAKIRYFKKILFRVFITKIPRTLYNAIDLSVPDHILKKHILYYKECIRLIDNYYPKKIKNRALTYLTGDFKHIGITELFNNRWTKFHIYKNYKCEILIGVTYV